MAACSRGSSAWAEGEFRVLCLTSATLPAGATMTLHSGWLPLAGGCAHTAPLDQDIVAGAWPKDTCHSHSHQGDLKWQAPAASRAVRGREGGGREN